MIPGVVCYFLLSLKYRFGYDDALDAFGIHGISGMLGSVFTGIFAWKVLGGVGIAGHNVLHQLLIQVVGILVVLVWSGGITYITLKLLDRWMGLRVSTKSELAGLDISNHGEIGYHVE